MNQRTEGSEGKFTLFQHRDIWVFINELQAMNAEYSYDHDVDILTIHLGEGTFEDGAELAPGLVAAYDREGNLLELELRNVRRIANADFDSRQLKKAA